MPAWKRSNDKVIKEVLELWRILLAAARDHKAYDITCVLDALDECRLTDRSRLINMLAKFYKQVSRSLPRTRRARLKFLITSRPYNDIRTKFQETLDNLPTIRLQGEEENDQIHEEINLVIRIRVTQLAKDLMLNSQTREQLETNLLNMKHRTYLWLYLAIEGISETYRNSLRPEEVVIKSLPSTVDDAYEKILSRTNEDQRSTVKTVLQIIVGARRPLAIQEMAIALGLATSTHSTRSLEEAQIDPIRLEANIRHWCGLFVFINHTRIYPIHQTAKEFLISISGTTLLSGWKYCLNPQEIEKDMARICLEFLSFYETSLAALLLVSTFNSSSRIDDKLEKDNYIQSLLVYSAEYWPSHFRDADIPINDSIMSKAFQFYDVDDPIRYLWFAIFWKTVQSRTSLRKSLPRMNSIQLAAFLGHEKLLQLILQSIECPEINESDDIDYTALVWASEFGYHKVVQILVDAGAEVNLGGPYNNVLQAASYGGHEKVVQILLDKGAEVNAQAGYHGTALQGASYGGHEKIVQMLLDNGAEVNTQFGCHDHALLAASDGGHEKIVQLLLERGAKVKTRGYRGNALYAAAGSGHEKIVQLLLKCGAEINTQGPHGDALYAAAGGGHENIVQLLLERGAPINTQGSHGSALRAASRGGHEKIVQILLKCGAQTDTQGGHGDTLFDAAQNGHENIVQILLESGADINAQHAAHGNALYAASSNGHEKVVQILLEQGADSNAQGGPYRSALEAALYGGFERIKSILKRRAKVNTRGGSHSDPVQAAAASVGRYEKVAQMLLERGAELNDQGEHSNALQMALVHGYEKAMQILLDKRMMVPTRRSNREATH